MRIDLQRDMDLLRQHLQQRVEDYGKSPNKGPGRDGDAVSQITLGYQFDQAGWLAVVFDTRPEAETDGHWNDFISPNQVELPQWYEAYQAWSGHGRTVEIMMPDGKVEEIAPSASDDRWAAVLGVALQKELQTFRDKDGFTRLPLASGAFLTVENHDGRFGWTDKPVEEKYREADPETDSEEDGELETEEAYLERLVGDSISFPHEKQIAHWIAVLERLAMDEENRDWSFLAEERAISELMKEQAIVDMLEYVRRWAGKPEYQGDKPGKLERLPMQGPVDEVLTTLENARWKCPAAEPILQDIVRQSCKANEGRNHWGVIPYRAAMCLYKHVEGYPEAVRGVMNNRLENASEFLKA